jgi:hypothetical protein
MVVVVVLLLLLPLLRCGALSGFWLMKLVCFDWKRSPSRIVIAMIAIVGKMSIVLARVLTLCVAPVRFLIRRIRTLLVG